MTAATTVFLDALKAAADQAKRAEDQFRREAAQRSAQLERERAFAFRRLNLMHAVAAAAMGAENEDIAVATALAVLRSKLGWSTESEARNEVLSRFGAVGQSVFRGLVHSEDAADEAVPDVLAEFETWYASSHQSPFWSLFEHYIPETPRVDF
jgi:hypothetical protein